MTTPGRNRIIRLAERDGSQCHYCEIPLDISAQQVLARPPWTPTSDHVIPRSAGGCDALGNLVLACLLCNNRRASIPYAEYLQRLGLAPRPDVLNRATQVSADAAKRGRALVPNPKAYPPLTAEQAREETRRATEAAMLRGIPRTLPPPQPVNLLGIQRVRTPTRTGLVPIEATPGGLIIWGKGVDNSPKDA